MGLDLRAAWRAWASYRGLGPRTRAFLLGRAAVAPLGPLGGDLRALRGRVLSVGCGHGLIERYLAEVNVGVEVEGIELDAGRVEAARSTESRSPRVRVRQGDVTRLDRGRAYAAALAVDVFHHLPPERHAPLAEALHDLLEPGGTCLVKDIAPTPRSRYLWNRLHDRIVAGPAPIHCRSPGDMAVVLESAGFRVDEVRRLERSVLYPHYLVRARRVDAEEGAAKDT